MSKELKELERQIEACGACEYIFSKRFVDPVTERNPLIPRPIFAGGHQCKVLLIGQAPGIKEYETGKAFQGGAGSEIRAILRDAGVAPTKFDHVVYQTSVTKCFPGRKKVKRKDSRTGITVYKEEDLVPSVRERNNCLPFLESQIRLLKPPIIITLGGFALKAYLSIGGRHADAKLENWVGRSEDWGGAKVIFFPHTSGSSRWLNSPSNRELFKKAKNLLNAEVARLAI